MICSSVAMFFGSLYFMCDRVNFVLYLGRQCGIPHAGRLMLVGSFRLMLLIYNTILMLYYEEAFWCYKAAAILTILSIFFLCIDLSCILRESYY